MKPIRSFRLSDETMEQLYALATASRMSTAGWLTAVISANYDKMLGNPKVMETLRELQSIECKLKELGLNFGGDDDEFENNSK